MHYALVTGLIFGAYGYLVANVISQPGEILWPIRCFIERIVGQGIQGWRYWLYKVTFGCCYCISGSHSLTILLFLGLYHYLFPVVVTAIFTAFSIQKFYDTERI